MFYKSIGILPDEIPPFTYAELISDDNYVSIHDNWAFGDNSIYREDAVLGIFTDLDFIWMATQKGFPSLMKIINKSPDQMLEYLVNNEKLIARPFFNKSTESLFKQYITKRKEEYKLP